MQANIAEILNYHRQLIDLLMHFHQCHMVVMVSDFQKLSEKIIQLADMTQQLRLENADLRLKAAALSSENFQMSQRMQEAHQRIAALMDKYPTPVVEAEAS